MATPCRRCTRAARTACTCERNRRLHAAPAPRIHCRPGLGRGRASETPPRSRRRRKPTETEEPTTSWGPPGALKTRSGGIASTCQNAALRLIGKPTHGIRDRPRRPSHRLTVMHGIVLDPAPAPKLSRSHRFDMPSLATLGRTLHGKVGRPDNLLNRRDRYNRTGDIDSIPQPLVRLSGRENNAGWPALPPCGRTTLPNDFRGRSARCRESPTDRRKSAGGHYDESHSTPRGSEQEKHA